ncbi:dihydrolipoamide dehydrogenase [Deinobacterium chartae]|uniref:Dihydrolipoamide dehydrogenase n=1 Tax=Deinobacterium chartae TaxID=521158 RepID=A0A841HTG6_9DEIO|nr:FAD-dependent oxidoreductase [Deinobacterium chartae]MBB6096647.1 dihydrolipoamide dehydrogenase [Deinobacterium chartae]
MQTVDVIIIGSGQGGVPLATALAERGQRVVLFERARLGGSCVNYGCTPSKAFLGAAHAAGRARQAARLGVNAEIRVDFAAVMHRVRQMAEQSSAHVRQRLEKAGVRIIHAEARFEGARRVSGGGHSFEARTVIINTGSAPALPDLEGLQAVPYRTYLDFWDLEALPRRTLVLGGGYIGLELGQGLARLGSEVHIIEPGQRVLAREAARVGETLRRALEADGVHFHLGARAQRVGRVGETLQLELESGRVLEADLLLVATGQRPNTGALNLSAAGIETDARGYVRADARLRAAEGVYVIGDAAGQPPFTHVAWEDHRRVLDALEGRTRSRDDRVLGYAVFTDPQVGRVGLDEQQAREQGLDARSVTLEVSDVARAHEFGQESGFYGLLVERGSDRILGATLVGPEAAEVVHTVLAHMEAGSTWRALEAAQHIHPTYAEGLPTLARQLLED